MSTDPFVDPAPRSGNIDYSELQGSLLMLEVLAREDGIRTVHTLPGEPPSTAMRVNSTVLDGPKAGTKEDDALIFPKVLVSQLRSRVGQWVLGRLSQGEATAGRTAPWQLTAATEQDKSVARQALAQRQQGTTAYNPAAPAATGTGYQERRPTQPAQQQPLPGSEPPF